MNDFIIIGAGQAGLAAAYYLKQQRLNFLVVDASQEIGASWLKRWDSLRLFTPSEYNHLPGTQFPCEKGYYPDKYQVANYLKKYVSEYDIPVEHGHLIRHLKKRNHHFILKSDTKTFLTKNVIVATGPFHTPYIPPCHKKLSKEIIQIHSEHYKNPKQLQAGDTLVVGSGDSGVQILEDIAKTNRQVYFSGHSNINAIPQEILGKTLWWWFSKLGFLSVSKHSWIGKKLSQSIQPIIGTDVKTLLSRDNITCVGKTLEAKGKNITFEKKEIASIKNIIWSTGFKPNFNWIDGITLDKIGYPKNYRGISDISGLYYIGLPWLHTRGSATLGGVKKDAGYLIKHIIKTRATSNLINRAYSHAK